ncbi:MAG: gluconate 2-dehydrogenase subunit 3 family protein [Thalassotalea sp.]
MLDLKITRRVFIGATACVVSVSLFGKVHNKVRNIDEIIKDGRFFTAEELTVLTDVAEIMIPKTTTVGATDVYVVPVLDELMITWAGATTKVQYRNAIQQIQTIAQNTYSEKYNNVALNQRQALIEQLDKTAFANKQSELSVNYRRLKEMIFHIYYTSEPANPDFVLIPGGYRGCLTKTELNEIKARGYL